MCIDLYKYFVQFYVQLEFSSVQFVISKNKRSSSLYCIVRQYTVQLATRMGTQTMGQLPEFHPESESISAYVERADLLFTANNIPDEKKVSVLLTVIGTNAYTQLHSLLSPEMPQTKTYEHLASGDNEMTFTTPEECLKNVRKASE